MRKFNLKKRSKENTILEYSGYSGMASKGILKHLVTWSHSLEAILPQALDSDKAGLEFLSEFTRCTIFGKTILSIP